MRKLNILLVIVLGLMLAVFPTAAQEATVEPTIEPVDDMSMTPEATAEMMGGMMGDAFIRVAHFAPDAPEVSVFIGGEPSEIQTISYPDVTGWVQIPAGTYSIAIVPVGNTLEDAAIGPVDMTFDPGEWTTIAAVGSTANDSLTAFTFMEDYNTTIDDANARVTLFHAIEGAPAVDVRLADGTVLASNLAYGESASIDLGGGTYDLQIVEAGTDNVLLDLGGTNITAGNFTILSAVGTADSPSVFVESVEAGAVEPLRRSAMDRTGTGTIFEALQNDGRFSTLTNLIEETGLTTTLNSEGPYTLFAPTDEAFNALGAETLNSLISDPARLQNILLYHVVEGEVPASDVMTMDAATTASGGDLTISAEDGTVTLNENVQVIETDIQASNGIIHVIDTVLMPPSQ